MADGDCLITPQLTINRTVIGDPKKDHKQMLADLAAVVQELRREAKAKGVNKLSRREINATVAAARRGMKKSGKQPVK